MTDGQQLEPLVLRFDVVDPGQAKLDAIEKKLDGVGQAMKRTEGQARAGGTGLGFLVDSFTRLPGPLGIAAGGLGSIGAALTRLPGVMGLVNGAIGLLGAGFSRLPSFATIASSGVTVLSAAIGRLPTVIGYATAGLGAFGAALARLPALLATVAGSVRVVTGSFGFLYRQLFSLHTLIVGFGVAWLASSFISAASEVEQYELRLRQLTGSAEEGNRIFADSAKFAEQVSFAYRDVIDSAVKMRAVIADTPDQTLTLVRLAADIAAASGLTLEATTDQLARTLSAGIGAADLWRERGVTAMLGFQQGVTYTNEQTIQMIADAWTRDGSVIRGAATSLVDTFSGQMSMLGDKWFQFRNRVMEAGVFELLTDGLRGLNAVLDHWLSRSEEAFGAGIQGHVNTLRANLGSLGQAMVQVVSAGIIGWALVRDAVWGAAYGVLQVVKWTNEAGAAIAQIMVASGGFQKQMASGIANFMPFQGKLLGADKPFKAFADSMGDVESFYTKAGDKIANNLLEINKQIDQMDKGLEARNFETYLEGSAATIERMKASMQELGEVFKAGMETPAEQVGDSIQQVEEDLRQLQTLISTGSPIDTAFEARQQEIADLVYQLNSTIEQMQRRELSQTPQGIAELFERDVEAMRHSMATLGILQQHEEAFWEYRRLLANEAADAIVEAERRIEYERREAILASNDALKGAELGMIQWAETQGTVAQQAANLTNSALYSTRDALAQFAVDISDRSKSIGDAFRDMALGVVQAMQRIIAQALATAAILAVLNLIPGMTAALTAMDSAAMTAGPAVNASGGLGAMNTPYLSGAATYHSGGLVGGAPFRMPASKGPAPDEVSAVLQRGEYVVSRRGVDALDRLNAGDAGAISGRGAERQVDRAVIIAEEDILTFAERSGRFRQAIVQITREDGGAR